jgi:exosortase
MSTVLEERNPSPASLKGWREGVLLLAGLAALYVPTFVDLARGPWREEGHAHGPLILAVCAALAWRGRSAFSRGARTPVSTAAGLALAAFGLALWLLGRTQSLVLFEAGSLLPLAAGLVLLRGGFIALRHLAFPLAFLAFYVPLPASSSTGPRPRSRRWCRRGVAGILGMLGYAVERSGVVLAVAGRELLVADACSGLNSIVSLAAMGLLYAHLTRASAARMALLALAIVPIAIAANIARVLALVLVTVHANPEAAQGWVHEALGLSAFVLALLMLVALDRQFPRKLHRGQVRARYLGQVRDRYVEMVRPTHLSHTCPKYLARTWPRFWRFWFRGRWWWRRWWRRR